MPKDPIKSLETLERNLDKRVGRVLNAMVFRIKKRVNSQEFLKWKSRRKPIVAEKSRLTGNLLTAKVRGASGWKWGHVHIGPAGSTTIRAKSGMLAVPTDFARKGSRPRSYLGTQVFAGVIWGRAGWGGKGTGGGLRQRRAAGEKFKKDTLVPLFILKGSVVVRRRIIPADMIRWIKPQFRAALVKARLLQV